jgi:MEMO1 family protein
VNVRTPAVAGLFYPDDPSELATTVDALLAAAPRSSNPVPAAIVVPHAGYVFSGPIAATAFATLLPVCDRISRVALFGPAHRAPIEGLALPTVDAFRTPLGDVAIDVDGRRRALELPGVALDDSAHDGEHSLEVQLPFLQRLLGDFTLVPFAVGQCAPATVARVIDALWGGPETIVVISSDLSHYEDYASAARHDRATAEAVLAQRADEIGPYDACGVYPLRGLLEVSRARELTPLLLDLRSSGDTAGPHDRVVGYGAFVMSVVP